MRLLFNAMRTSAMACAFAAALAAAQSENAEHTTKAAPVPADGESTTGDCAVKASFLCKFSNFVEWPEKCSCAETGVFKIGILGADPFNGTLEQYLQKRKIKDCPPVIERAENPADLLDCHIVYIAGQPPGELPGILAAFQNASVLTVGETDAFLRRGGIIRFYKENGKIRFTINPDAARKVDLKISSQLLLIANVTQDSQETEP